jgi:hypothetical protein
VIVNSGDDKCIKCLDCGWTSWNENDVGNRYCRYCRELHDDKEKESPSRSFVRLRRTFFADCLFADWSSWQRPHQMRRNRAVRSQY